MRRIDSDRLDRTAFVFEVIEGGTGYQLGNVPCVPVAGHRQPFGRNAVPCQGLRVLAWLASAIHPCRREGRESRRFGATREG